MRTAEGKFTCDLCKLEFDIYPPPQSLVVTHVTKGPLVLPDVCQECQNKIYDYLETLKA